MEMSPEKWERAKLLFEAALDRPPEQRIQYLQDACAEDDLRGAVIRLLANVGDAGSFLNKPALTGLDLLTAKTEDGFLPSGKVLADRFKLIRFVARGGMGEVYEAQDLELHECVALKLVRPNLLLDPHALRRFKREVHLAKKVTHPNVCRTFDLFRHRHGNDGFAHDLIFVSMELLVGETLSQFLRQKGGLAPAQALPLITQIAEGMEAAHRVGVIHRDFKPGNIILVSRGTNSPRAVITDFGLALRANGAGTTEDLSASHGILGTPAYMAPEQIEGRQATPATDVYAFGLVIYEMVAGVRPFDRQMPFSEKENSSSLLPPLKRVLPEISDCWDETIVKCLQRDPAARFSSASEVAKALSDQPATSCSSGRAYKRVAVTGLVAALLLTVATAYFFRGWLPKGSTRTVHAATRPTVAVLGFKNLSKKSDVDWISPAFSEMLSTELTAGEQLRIIPSEQVAHAKTDLSLTQEDSLGRDTLARVRQNLGSDLVILGSFLDMNGQVRVDVTLQNATLGETVANISESGSEQQLADLATHAGGIVRHKLGLGDPAPAEAADAKAAQSPSLEATRYYSEGLEKLHSYDAAGARKLLEQAISNDPDFALAHAGLAEAWRSLGYNKKSEVEARKALDLSMKLSRENRLAIEAQYKDATHDTKGEAEIYKSLFTFYPDNLEYGLALAKSEYYGAQWREAEATLDELQQLKSPEGDDPRIDHVRSAVALQTGDYKKALALDERVALRAQDTGARRMLAQALQGECFALWQLGESAKAIASCEKSRALFEQVGDYTNEANLWGEIAFHSGVRGDKNIGREANDRQIALLKKTESDGGLAYAMTVAGELSADSGDYSRALQEYTEALDLYQKIGSQSGIISSYGNLGWVHSLKGNLNEALKDDEHAISLARQTNTKNELDLWLQDFADDLLAKGDVAGAAKALGEGLEVNQETQNKRARIYLHTSRANLLLAEGALDESRREAELATKTSLEFGDGSGDEERKLILARLDIAEHHPENAIEGLHKSLDYFSSKKDEDGLIETRTILIEALLAAPSEDSRRQITVLTKLQPHTQNEKLRLAAKIQFARARGLEGDRQSAIALLDTVISDSQRMGYEPRVLEAKLAKAEVRLQSPDAAAARVAIEGIAKQADAEGLKLLATQAQSLLK
jgi:eukaryotic-like serine/threonine-protein kinase